LISGYFHPGVIPFNPYGVGVLYDTKPRFHLGLFIFNPYGVDIVKKNKLKVSRNQNGVLTLFGNICGTRFFN